jgi:hypothetical protein
MVERAAHVARGRGSLRGDQPQASRPGANCRAVSRTEKPSRGRARAPGSLSAEWGFTTHGHPLFWQIPQDVWENTALEMGRRSTSGRPRGNPRLVRGVQPPWLSPYNLGRRRGSRNRPKPGAPELIHLRLFEPSEANEALLGDPPEPTSDEMDELMCHLLDIRRQRQRWQRYVKRYQPWRRVPRSREWPPRRSQ